MKNKTSILFCLVTLIIVFTFFYQTLFFKVKLFDEVTIFKESYLPVCFSIYEIFELIPLLGLNHYFEATNTLYSNISSIRCDPIGNFIQLLVQLFCRKNPVSYHLYSLILHLINTSLVFLILKRVSFLLSAKPSGLAISLLTLFWALHPVNIEPVLLITNANVLLSYSFCFLIIFIYLKLLNKDFVVSKINFPQSLLLFFAFLTALFMAEYHFILPLLLICYFIGVKITSNTVINSFVLSIKITLPLLIAAGIFIFNFLISGTRVNITLQNSLNLVLERALWLSPQIIFHYLKLFFFPLQLSIDQTFLVKIGKSLTDPYAIFCFFIVFLIIIISLTFLLRNSQFAGSPVRRFASSPILQSSIFFALFLFLISLIPFSHILAPIYNLASERYLYFPSFIFVFGISHFLFLKTTQISQKTNLLVLIILFIISGIYGTRAYIRTLDWKSSESLYLSSIHTSKNPLHKAFRYKGLTPQKMIFVKYPEKEVDLKNLDLANVHLRKAISDLKIAKKKYQKNIPDIVKSYGLDPSSLLAKAGYIWAQTDFTLNQDSKKSLEMIKPFVKDLSILDSAGLSFYSSLLYYNNLLDETEKVLKYAYKQNPFAIRIIYPLCDLIQIKYGNLNEIEKYTLKAFQYFPYDTFTLLVLTKIYKLKGDLEKYAHFSYAYGLRHHSIEDLNNAKSIYLTLNNTDKVKKIEGRIKDLKKGFNKNLAARREAGDGR